MQNCELQQCWLDFHANRTNDFLCPIVLCFSYLHNTCVDGLFHKHAARNERGIDFLRTFLCNPRTMSYFESEFVWENIYIMHGCECIWASILCNTVLWKVNRLFFLSTPNHCREEETRRMVNRRRRRRSSGKPSASPPDSWLNEQKDRKTGRRPACQRASRIATSSATCSPKCFLPPSSLRCTLLHFPSLLHQLVPSWLNNFRPAAIQAATLPHLSTVYRCWTAFDSGGRKAWRRETRQVALASCSTAGPTDRPPACRSYQPLLCLSKENGKLAFLNWFFPPDNYTILKTSWRVKKIYNTSVRIFKYFSGLSCVRIPPNLD